MVTVTAMETATDRGSSLARQGAMDVLSDSDTNDQLAGLEALELYQTDEEDILLMSPSTHDTTNPKNEVNGVAKEVKPIGEPRKGDDSRRVAGYKRSIRYLKQLARRDPATLTTREKRLKRKHEFHVRKYESFEMNTTVVEVRPPDVQKEQPVSNTSQSEVPLVVPSTSGGSVGSTKISSDQTDKSGPRSKKSITATATQLSSSAGTAPVREGALKSGGKRQRSGETKVSEGKRLKPSTSFPSAPELQVAILDRSHPEGRMTTDRWLLMEERILRSLVDALAHSEDDSFTEFDGAKWNKGIKIVGCGNEKALEFLRSTIQDLDELWPGMNVDVVPVDQIPYQATVKVWVPPPVIEDEAILTLLKRQNKGLGSDGWRIIRGRARDKGDGKDLWLKVSSESLRLLRLSKGMVKFGLNHLKVILPGGNSSNDDP